MSAKWLNLKLCFSGMCYSLLLKSFSVGHSGKNRKMLIINGQHIRLSLKWRLLLPPRLNIHQTKKPQILFYFHLRRVPPGDHADAVILGFPETRACFAWFTPPKSAAGQTDGRRCDGDAAWWRHKHLAAAASPMTIYTVFISRPSGDRP